MKFAIGQWELIIELKNRLPWEREAARLVRRVDFEADAEYEHARYYGSLKVVRIKRFRQVANDKGWGLGLKDCKEWVERHFIDDGRGEPR